MQLLANNKTSWNTKNVFFPVFCITLTGNYPNLQATIAVSTFPDKKLNYCIVCTS